MKYKLPYTIDNGLGQKIIFKEIILEADGDKLITEGSCKPNTGPTMHVHYQQDEGFTVIKGHMMYQLQGGEPVSVEVGQSAIFKRGTPHRFWNAGDTDLEIRGWLKPANNVIFFLSTLYAAQQASGNDRPEMFDAAYITTRYKSEFCATEIPAFVRKVIMPIVYTVGKLTGKYKKFSNAPAPM